MLKNNRDTHKHRKNNTVKMATSAAVGKAAPQLVDKSGSKSRRTRYHDIHSTVLQETAGIGIVESNMFYSLKCFQWLTL